MGRYLVDRLEYPWGEWEYRVTDIVDGAMICLCRSKRNAETIAKMFNDSVGVK